MKIATYLKFIVLIVLSLFYANAKSQDKSDDIAKKLANPVASLISVPFQFNFQFNFNDKSGGYSGYKMLLNFQPVVPVPLGKKINLINRLIVPVITQKNVTALNIKEEGLGDILYTAFFSPANSKIIWGIGPAVSFPSATDDVLGTKKLLLGPSVVILGQPGKWTVGALMTQTWSVAGNKDREEITSGFMQPFISYGFNGGFTVGVSSENSYDWRGKRLTSGLIALTITQVFKFAGTQMASFGINPVVYYANSKIKKPEWGVRALVTFVFPK